MNNVYKKMVLIFVSLIMVTFVTGCSEVSTDNGIDTGNTIATTSGKSDYEIYEETLLRFQERCDENANTQIYDDVIVLYENNEYKYIYEDVVYCDKFEEDFHGDNKKEHGYELCKEYYFGCMHDKYFIWQNSLFGSSFETLSDYIGDLLETPEETRTALDIYEETNIGRIIYK